LAPRDSYLGETRSADDQISCPFGKDAVGYITYNEDRCIFVAITRSNHVKFAAGDLLEGSKEEIAQAADTYVSYCGRYEFQEDRIIHHETSAYAPTGSGLTRNVWSNLEGESIDVEHASDIAWGEQQSAHLLWERA
jgi:hypothetical protein